MKHTLILLLSLFLFVGALATGARAQNENIITVLQMSPNPSPYLSDWQSRRETVTLIATLDREFPTPVKLMAQVKLNGSVVAETNPDKTPPLTLHQGTNTFNAADIIPYEAVSFKGGIDQSSKRLGRLPEGRYEICVWFIGTPGAQIASPHCQAFTILGVNPPELISPAENAQFNIGRPGNLEWYNLSSVKPMMLDELVRLEPAALRDLRSINLTGGGTQALYTIDQKVTERDSSEAMQIPIMNTSRLMEEEGVFYYRYQMKDVMVSGYSLSGGGDNPTESFSINFTWLPPMPMPNTPVKYRLRIVPVLLSQDKNNAISVNTPLGKDVLLFGKTSAEFNYDGISEIITSNLARTHQFAWAVQAQDQRGNPIGKNNGWSAPRAFGVGDSVTSEDHYRIGSFFDILLPIDFVPPGDPDFDVLRIKGDKPDSTKVDSTKPCPYTYKELSRLFMTPCKDQVRSLYEVWKIYSCTLFKGHSGEHTLANKEVTIKKWTASCTPNSKVPEGVTVEPAPPKDKVGDKKDIENIPAKEEADKKFGANTAPNVVAGNNTNINIQPEKCPFAYKKAAGNLYFPAGGGLCKYYKMWEVFRCSLPKGHAGDHHGAMDSYYELLGTVRCPDGRADREPPKDQVISGEDLDKIPTEAEAKKADAAVKVPAGKEPCPYGEKKLLRTVTGPWKKISTTVRHITWRDKTVAWVDVVWERDVFNVFEVSHCTLEKGHAGAHKMGPKTEVKEKYGTFTEKMSYGPGVPQAPPKPHPTDALPEE